MARAFVIDGRGFATKVKNTKGHNWRSDACISCPNCRYVIDNSQVIWPGLPAGVKFDPTEQELIQHLEEKVGIDNQKPHPFIDEFILKVDDENGIHPENLPGAKQDGRPTHVFHKTSKAYATGQRKCRKVSTSTDDSVGGQLRWHKTGTTRPVKGNGVQKGCKKIMVLYNTGKGSKAAKTKWVMHQYHLGTQEEETEGQFVVSKVFYQQENSEKGGPQENAENGTTSIVKVDPITPDAYTPPFERPGNSSASVVIKEEGTPSTVSPQAKYLDTTTHQSYKGKEIKYDTQYLNATLGHYSSSSADLTQYLDSQNLDSQIMDSQFMDSQIPDSQELDFLCPEMIGNQAFQGIFGTPVPYLTDCGRIRGNVSEGGQKIDFLGSEMIGNQAWQGTSDSSMPYLTNCGRIGVNVSKSPQKIDFLGSEMIGNQACQGTSDSSMPYLSDCGRIGANVSKSPQKIVKAGKSIPTLSENGCIANHEPGKRSNSGIHESEKELTENCEADSQNSLLNIHLDTPPSGSITFSSSQDTQNILAWLNEKP